jgi:hypothetical protein
MAKILEEHGILKKFSEAVFLKVYGAQESVPRTEFRKPM